ncbi:MAG: 3-hydroxyacyl-CoA dehydrogenase NAD-binding domain-containing protein, partial [Firmicutes bacterium]|nr:3-hydroxyacyl-CoA dehydrogenase NAD-binding domain-containing protein [Bacillota bacterium]
MSGIKTVAVLGAGTMGHSIAIAIMQRMIPVRLVDVSAPALDNAREKISNYLENRVKDDKLTLQESNKIFRGLNTFTQIDRGVAGADMVIEAVPENPDLKIEIFKRLDKLCPPGVILATNTSGIPINSVP